METTWDKLRPVVFALCLHALVIGLLVMGVLWQPPPAAANAEGPMIEATLVSFPEPAINVIKQETARDTPTLPRPEEPKTPGLVPQQHVALQASHPKPDTMDDDHDRRIAEHAARENLQDQRAQLTHNDPPAETAATHPPIGNSGDDMAGLLERYRAALHTTANVNWDPAGVPSGVHCMVRFTQIPGGEVIAVNYEDCPLDATARESIERAMHKGSMPYAGFESVFSRQATIDFCTPEEACTDGAP